MADDTLFSGIHDSSSTRNELHDDLVKINNWAYHYKTNFDQDSNKQAQEAIFNRKTKKINYLLKLLLKTLQVELHLKNILV